MGAGADTQLYVVLRLALLPASAAAAALVAARLGRVRGAVSPRTLAVGATIGVGSALVGFAGVPSIPPIDTIGWIPFALAATLPLLLLLHGHRGAQLAALAALAGVSAWLLGRPLWPQSPGITVGLALAVSAALVPASAAGFARAAEQLHPFAATAATTALAAGAAVACLASHSALLALVLGGIAVTTGTLAVGCLIVGVRSSGNALFGVLLLPLSGLILYAHLYSGLPVAAVALLAGAALAPLAVAAMPPFRLRALVAPLLVAALATGAAALAQQAGAAVDDDPNDAYYQ